LRPRTTILYCKATVLTRLRACGTTRHLSAWLATLRVLGAILSPGAIVRRLSSWGNEPHAHNDKNRSRVWWWSEWESSGSQPRKTQPMRHDQGCILEAPLFKSWANATPLLKSPRRSLWWRGTSACLWSYHTPNPASLLVIRRFKRERTFLKRRQLTISDSTNLSRTPFWELSHRLLSHLGRLSISKAVTTQLDFVWCFCLY
jgi:hypothetical protein